MQKRTPQRIMVDHGCTTDMPYAQHGGVAGIRLINLKP